MWRGAIRVNLVLGLKSALNSSLCDSQLGVWVYFVSILCMFVKTFMTQDTFRKERKENVLYSMNLNAVFSNRERDSRGGFICVIHAYLSGGILKQISCEVNRNVDNEY